LLPGKRIKWLLVPADPLLSRSTLVVPFVLFATVVILQLLWVKVLRRRVLRRLLRRRWLMRHMHLTDMLSIQTDLEHGFSVTPGSIINPAGARAMDASASCPAAVAQIKPAVSLEDDSPFLHGMLGAVQPSVAPGLSGEPSKAAAGLAQRVTCPADFGVKDRVRFAHRRSFSFYVWEHVIATALVVFFDVYTNLATVAVGLLMCVKAGDAGDNVDRWVMDVRLTCPRTDNGKPWSIGAAILSSILLLLCLGLPVAIAIVLLRQAYKGNLKGHLSASAMPADLESLPTRPHRRVEDHITARLAYRYQDYAADFDALRGPQGLQRFWHADTAATQLRTCVVLVWDSVLDLHRFLLAVVALCVELHEVQQVILVAAVLGIYLALILALRPWKSSAVWYLQATALFLLVGSCLGIVACNAGAGLDPATRGPPLIPWMILGLNGCYVLVAVGFLVRCVWREVRVADCCRSTLARVRSFADM
jgi:hypothetical protein